MLIVLREEQFENVSSAIKVIEVGSLNSASFSQPEKAPSAI